VLQGYRRVSTADQNPDAQRDALIRAGVAPDQLYLDHTSGAKSSRPAWDALRKALRAGDVLVATRLDRVGRSTSHLVTLLGELAARGVAFRFLEQGIDTTTSEGRLMYRMLAAIAEFQRDLIIANTREGLAAARARGRKGGRKPKLTTQQIQLAQQLYDAGEKTVAEIAAIFTVARTTIYGHLNNGSAGARPRARKPPAPTTATAQTTEAPARPAGVHADALRPRLARIEQTDEPLSVRELQLPARLVRQREAMRVTRCPSCGNEPVDAQTRRRQRQDLTTIWLHLDSDGTLREQRHCVACQPYDQPVIIECDRCGDGPLVTGLPATTPPGQWPTPITRWLHNNAWRTDPEPRCGNHH
jgi:DNA invertase Pin-like site-specific DNA recombinase